MKFAVSLAFSDPLHYCALAKAAEEAGFSAVGVSDHVVHPENLRTPYPYTPDGKPRWEPFTDWPDPWVAIGAMTSVTERIRFYTSIFVLPMRNPFLVAKAIGTAAVMSGDRVSLGIGAGWMRDEFELLEQSFERRGRRMDEMIEVMHKLWSGGWVEHKGEFYAFDRLEMSPVPRSPVPILVGGFSEPALRRAARLGDGWISDIHSTDEIRELIKRLHGYRAEYGREGLPFEVYAAANDAFNIDGYRRLEEAGVTQLLTLPWVFYGGSPDSIDDKIDGVRRYGEDIIAKM
jgi:probable F420-dependent oxidoreductase